MNILSLDSPYSPFFSLVVRQMRDVESFHGLFSKLGYRHYFSGQKCQYIGTILRQHREYTEDDRKLVSWSNNHYSAYTRKFENRELSVDELEKFARFANYFRTYLKEHSIDFVMMHNDLRWHHAIAREVCLEEGVAFLVSELGLFRPYTMTVDFHGVNANSSIAKLDVDFSQYANMPGKEFDVPYPFYGHESTSSKFNFGYFLVLNKIGGVFGCNSPISHNTFRIRPYIKRFWQQSVKQRIRKPHKVDEALPEKPYVFFPMQLENDTQFLIHSDFSSNQSLLQQVENAFYRSSLASTHQLVVKLHPNDLGCYQAEGNTLFTKVNTTSLVNASAAVISVNSTVCMEALETDKPLYVLGRAFFARSDVAQPCEIAQLSEALSRPNHVNVDVRRGFLHYLKYEYSIHGAGFSYTKKQLQRVADEIERKITEKVN